MKSKFQQVAKHGIVYGLGHAGQQLIGFLLLPIYTSYLTVDDYGRLAIISTASALLQIVLNAGISYSIFKFYFKAKSRDEEINIISSALFWLLGLGVIFILLFWRFSAPLADLIMGKIEGAVYLKLMVLNLVFTVLQIIPLGIFRAQKKSLQYALLTVSSFLVGMGLNIYFVVALKLGMYGILLAGVLTSLVFLLVGLYYNRGFIRPVFSWTLAFSMLKFGLPMLPSGLSNYVLRQADRWFLKYYASLDAVGIYSLGYKIGETINLFFAQPITLIWLPIVFEMEDRPNANKFYERMLTYVALIGLWMALGLSLLGREILILMTTPEYHGAYMVIPWVAVSYVVYSCYFVINIGILLKNKTSFSILIVGVSAVSNIIFNFILIPSFGLLGAAQATLFSYLVLFAVTYGVNHYFFPLNYEWRRIFRISVVFLILLVVGNYISGGIVFSLFVKFTLLGAYWIILLFARFFTPDELSSVRFAIKKYLPERFS